MGRKLASPLQKTQPEKEKTKMILVDAKLSDVIQLNNRESRCFMKARRLNMPSFTIIACDQTAADTVEFWLSRNPQLSPEVRAEVETKIAIMQQYEPKKAAD